MAGGDRKADRRPDASGGGPLFFVHIPKTAGGTLKSVLARAYGKRAIVDAGNYSLNPEITREKVLRTAYAGNRIVIGHVPFALFTAVAGEGVRFITMMRDPVERVLSHYYSHLHNKGEVEGKLLRSLGDALAAGMPQVTNLLTRFLSDDPEAEIGPAALAEAKRNLDRFTLVGLQERFDESVVLLHRVLGMGEIFPYGEWRHVNEQRPRAADLRDGERESILAGNRLDLELYAHARGLFETNLARSGEDLEPDMDRLRALSGDALQAFEAALSVAAGWMAEGLPPGVVRRFRDLADAAEVAGIASRPFKQALRKLRLDGLVVAGTVGTDGAFRPATRPIGLVPLVTLDDAVLRRLGPREIAVPVVSPRSVAVPSEVA